MKKLVLMLITLSVMFTGVACGQVSEKTVDGASNIIEDHVDSSDEMKDLPFEILRNTYNNYDSNNNFMISPLSIEITLAMLYNGAAGDTKELMTNTLGFDESLEELNKRFNMQSDDVLGIANGLWVNTIKGNAKETYINTLKNSYNAECISEDFGNATVNEINSFVDKNTYGMIKSIMDSVNTSDDAILINCVAFDDKWKTPYTESEIYKESKFTNINGEQDECTMLSRIFKNGNYLESDKLKAKGFIQEYKSEYKFISILPYEEGVDAINYTLDNLNSDTYKDFVTPLTGEYILRTELPQFKFENTLNLNSALNSMGLQGLLSDADYSNLVDTGRLSNATMLHKTYVELDATGTKAAAVTAMEIEGINGGEYKRPKEYVVYLDRPFIFIIADKSNDPIFIGVVKGLQ